MAKEPTASKLTTKRERRYYHVAALALCGLIFAGVCTYVWFVGEVEAPNGEPAVVEVAPAIVPTGASMPESAPARLRIPEVGIDTTFERGLGLNEDQTIEVPDSFTEVGWYRFGPTPGEYGPAVIIGHVDSREGPAVFWSLGQLQEGSEILVDREDGTTARFLVTELRRVSQDTFPTKDVYGDIDHAGLRLITCSGTFNRGVHRYTHNLIVYAKLVDEAGTEGEVVEEQYGTVVEP